MRKLIAITHVSLDGVMQAPGGPEEDTRGGFTQGGWSMHYRSDEGRRLVEEIVAGDFDLLLGRKTYRIFAGYWPKQGEHPIAKGFNKAVKFVATKSTAKLRWKNSRAINGDIAEGVRQLKASDGPEIHIWGSGKLLQALIAADLIDEFRIWTFPVVLGSGRRLFERGVPARGLSLVSTMTTPTGVILSTYRPAGAVGAL